MDRRDEYASWQDAGGRAGGQGERWAYEDDPRVPSPRSPGYPRGPRSGEPLPPPAPDPLFDPFPPPAQQQPERPLHEPTGAVDATALRRSLSQTDGLYRSRKPIFMVLYGAVAGLGELLMLRPFFDGLFDIDALAPLLAMIAFPLLAVGMYGLATGAATAVQFQGPRVWLRTPLVYLPIALVLLVGAGTAVV